MKKRTKQKGLPQSITSAQWEDHFKSLHQMKTCNYHHFKPILGIYDEILDGNITVDEIYTVLGQMKYSY